MLWLYLLLVVIGGALTYAHVRRRARYRWVAVAGTVLAAYAVLSGFSIGIYVAPVALLVLAAAALLLGRRDRAN